MSVFRIAAAFAALAGLPACTAQITQDSFFPRSGVLAKPGELAAPTGYTISHAMLDFGEAGIVHAAFLDNPASDVAIVYHGGNMSFVSGQTNTANALALATGADLIFYDYPGRGGTTVPATIEAVIGLGNRMIGAFKAKGWIGKRPAFNYGLSFGGSQAAAMARHGGFAGLIIEGSAPDFEGIGKDFVPGIAKPFVKLRVDPALKEFDYLGYAKATNAPVLLISGKDDTVIRPKRMQAFGEALQAGGTATRFVSVSGGHGAALADPATRAALQTFVLENSKK